MALLRHSGLVKAVLLFGASSFFLLPEMASGGDKIEFSEPAVTLQMPAPERQRELTPSPFSDWSSAEARGPISPFNLSGVAPTAMIRPPSQATKEKNAYDLFSGKDESSIKPESMQHMEFRFDTGPDRFSLDFNSYDRNERAASLLNLTRDRSGGGSLQSGWKDLVNASETEREQGDTRLQRSDLKPMDLPQKTPSASLSGSAYGPDFSDNADHRNSPFDFRQEKSSAAQLAPSSSHSVSGRSLDPRPGSISRPSSSRQTLELENSGSSSRQNMPSVLGAPRRPGDLFDSGR